MGIRKTYASILTGFLLMIFAGHALAQQKLVSDTNKRQLDAIQVRHKSQFSVQHQKALSMAASHNWPVRKKTKNGGLISLQSVNSLGFPVFLKTTDNIISAATTRTNTVQPGGSTGLNLSGSSVAIRNKLAIWDGGAVYAAHQEFAGKNITINTSVSTLDHSTHVAGTMIAKGVYAPAKGMAFNATTLASYDFDDDINTISGAASGLLLSNHSYGDLAGWDLDDLGDWYWYGLPGDTVDYTFGIYNDRTRSYDEIAYNAPSYLIVESAGNARGYNGPDIGGEYYGYESRTSSKLILKPRTAASKISSQFGYDGIASTGNAKNILTIGAVGPIPFGPVRTSDVQAAYFTSYGPTDDGRIKPDIAGMGVNVLSCTNTSPVSYLVLSGTSMAAPNVTGSLYLLQEYYEQKHPGNFMHSSTLKALACGTAFDAGNVGPDYQYGWGLLDMQKAAQAITDNGSKSLVMESQLQQGQTVTRPVIASGNGPLVATIAWTDPPAIATDDGVVNDRTIKLVNDLDIRISDGTTTFKPWVLDPLHPEIAATTGDNIRDNVEQVYIPNTVPGRAYTITVSHKGTLKQGPQTFSMVVTGMGGTSYCTSGPTSSADSRINGVSISNLKNTPAAGCTTYSDYTSMTANLALGNTYQLSLALGTCGSNFNKVAKVFIDWNDDGNFNGAGELVATSPVISQDGTYKTSVTVPTTVVPGNYSLMRVVLTETDDTSAVKACGSYAKGETQDYRVLFLKSATDAGVTAIASPDTVGNCSGTTPITITLKNFGSAAISNVPVTVTVKAPDNSVTNIQDTYTGTLAPEAEDNLTLSTTFNAAAGANYVITAKTNLANDVLTSNDQATSTITVNPAPVISTLNANYCVESSKYLLTGAGDGELFWYNSPAGTNLVAFGSPVLTSQPPLNNTYYAGLNDFTGTVGPATKNIFTGGGYDQFTPDVTVHADAPVVIESARLYIGSSGEINFKVTDLNGQTVSSTTIDAVATRSNPHTGAETDDPNDQGKVYTLNLLLPAAGNYIITTTFDGTASLFRNNSGVTGYPFKSGIFSITGNTADDGSGDTTYSKGFYYYFYDIKVKSAGCPSAVRQAVTLVRPVITQNGTTLSSNFAAGNQWYLNGKAVSGATDQTLKPPGSGLYKLFITLSSGCTDTSASYVYIAAPNTSNKNDIGLTVYPVPANDKLNVFFVAKSNDDLTTQLISSDGRVVLSTKESIAAGNYNKVLNVEKEPAGIYILKLTLGTKVYSSKIIIER